MYIYLHLFFFTVLTFCLSHYIRHFSWHRLCFESNYFLSFSSQYSLNQTKVVVINTPNSFVVDIKITLFSKCSFLLSYNRIFHHTHRTNDVFDQYHSYLRATFVDVSHQVQEFLLNIVIYSSTMSPHIKD